MSNVRERKKFHENTFAMLSWNKKKRKKRAVGNLEKDKLRLMKFSFALCRQFCCDCVVLKNAFKFFVVALNSIFI